MSSIHLDKENGRLADENKAIGSRLKACVEASRGLRDMNKHLLADVADLEVKLSACHGWLKEATDALREVLEENKKLRGLVK